MELQRETRRIIPSRRTEMRMKHVHRHPATCLPRETDQWKLRYCRRDQSREDPREDANGLDAARATTTRNYSNRIHKTSQLPSPQHGSESRGTTKEPYAVHKAFLCRPPARPRPLFARQFDTDLQPRSSQIACRPEKYHDRIIETLKFNDSQKILLISC